MSVNSCCGCISLETGTIIIAVISIISSIYGFIGLFIVGPLCNSQNGTIASPGIVLVIAYIINLILSVMLLMGIAKKKANYILPILWWSVIGLLISIVITCVNPPPEIAKMGLGLYLISYLIGLGIGIYLWLVIYSFYQKLRMSEQAGPEVNRVYDKNISRGPSNINVLI